MDQVRLDWLVCACWICALQKWGKIGNWPNLQTVHQNTYNLKLFNKIYLFFKLNFNKIKLYIKFDISNVQFYSYFIT